MIVGSRAVPRRPHPGVIRGGPVEKLRASPCQARFSTGGVDKIPAPPLTTAPVAILNGPAGVDAVWTERDPPERKKKGALKTGRLGGVKGARRALRAWRSARDQRLARASFSSVMSGAPLASSSSSITHPSGPNVTSATFQKTSLTVRTTGPNVRSRRPLQ